MCFNSLRLLEPLAQNMYNVYLVDMSSALALHHFSFHHTLKVLCFLRSGYLIYILDSHHFPSKSRCTHVKSDTSLIKTPAQTMRSLLHHIRDYCLLILLAGGDTDFGQALHICTDH